MLKNQSLSILSLVLSLAACCLAALAWQNSKAKSGPQASPPNPVDPAVKSTPKDGHPKWLRGSTEENFQEVEQHLRGTDIAMMEVGYRFTELHFAGQDRNWPYALRQITKMEKALRLATVRRPKRSPSIKAFLEQDLPEVREAIEKRDAAAFTSSMKHLRTACMKCHVLEKVPNIIIMMPQRRLAPVGPTPSKEND